MQFVKNALEAQGSRTVFQKLREAALAYHLERQWDKDKILTQYLNTIYFGEGAYGIEAAARTYFGCNHPGCGEDGRRPLRVASCCPRRRRCWPGSSPPPPPSRRASTPTTPRDRRNLVLQKMNEQGVLSDEEYEDAARRGAARRLGRSRSPRRTRSRPTSPPGCASCSSTSYGAGKAFGGGLDVNTTLDLDMQEAVEGIAYNTLAGSSRPPRSSSSTTRPARSGRWSAATTTRRSPFNLATNGHRQPGSAFKPFTLVTAFENGALAERAPTSRAPQEFTVPNSGGKEVFEVHNYDDIYYGASDLATATVHSDNSVFAELGYVGSPQGKEPPGAPTRSRETAERDGDRRRHERRRRTRP